MMRNSFFVFSISALITMPFGSAFASTKPLADLEVTGVSFTPCKFILVQGDTGNGQHTETNMSGLKTVLTIKNNGPTATSGTVSFSGDTSQSPVSFSLGSAASKEIILFPRNEAGSGDCMTTFTASTKTLVATMSSTVTDDPNTANNSKTISVNYPAQPATVSSGRPPTRTTNGLPAVKTSVLPRINTAPTATH